MISRPRCSLPLKVASSSGKRSTLSALCSASSALIGALRLSSWFNSTTQSRHVCRDARNPEVFPLRTFVSFVVNEVKMLEPQRTRRSTKERSCNQIPEIARTHSLHRPRSHRLRILLRHHRRSNLILSNWHAEQRRRPGACPSPCCASSSKRILD